MRKFFAALAGSFLAVAATVAAAAPTAAAATPDQRVMDLKKQCSISVPADWKNDGIASAPHSPDKHASAIVGSTTAASTIAAVKPVVQQMYAPTRTFEESAKRLWYQYEGNDTSLTYWYVAVPGKGGMCTATISYQASPAEEALARKIALSLAPAS